MIVAGLAALIGGLFLLITEVKDPTQLIAITLVVMGAAILIDLGWSLRNR